MRTKLTFILTGIIISMMFLGVYAKPPVPTANTIELKIMKINNVWKVVLASDQSKFKVKVKRNTTITWTAVGSDVSFQFPDYIFSPVRSIDSLKSRSTKYLKKGKKLT